MFWLTCPSHQVTPEEGAHALAAYVRRVVLPATYAAKINVVGYRVGGLLARWNAASNVDGWGTLVNRLILVGVPNERDGHGVRGRAGAVIPAVLWMGANPVGPHRRADLSLLAREPYRAKGLAVRAPSSGSTSGRCTMLAFFAAGADRTAGALLDRFLNAVDEASSGN